MDTLSPPTTTPRVEQCSENVLHERLNIFYNEKAVSFGPTILTTLGIFATFLGIAFGLSEFDANNIQASVPALLGGLKTAFWASVAGVGGALLF